MSNITPPSISISAQNNGEPYPGNTLVCTPGTYNGEPTLSHNWTRDGADISGATNPSSYPITEEDVGHVINIRETATYPAGGDTSSETAVTPRLGPPTVDSAPVIEISGGGPETAPATLQVTSATVWSHLNGQSISSKWLRNGSEVGGGSSISAGEAGGYKYVETLNHEGIEVVAESNEIGLS
jgi:hypothetical protein